MDCPLATWMKKESEFDISRLVDIQVKVQLNSGSVGRGITFYGKDSIQFIPYIATIKESASQVYSKSFVQNGDWTDNYNINAYVYVLLVIYFLRLLYIDILRNKSGKKQRQKELCSFMNENVNLCMDS